MANQVTVVIPVYNVEAYIYQAIESVLAQTYPYFEVILVNDGSKDRSIEICQKFDDPRIKILHQENQGPAAARNHGIRHAVGEYVAFLDGDDLWTPDKLAKHVDHLDRNPEVGVSFCPSRFIDDQGDSIGLYQITKMAGITPMDLLCRTPIGNGSVPVIRKSVLEAISFVNEAGETHYFNPDRRLHPSEDVDCWLRIALKTQCKFEGVAEALTLYRVSSASCSAQLTKKLNSWEAMLKDLETWAPEESKGWYAPAMAYQFRHLARRSVSLRDGAEAVKLMHQAIATYRRILLEEPSRTLQTLAAAYLLQILPRQLYQKFEAIAVQLTGAMQRYRMNSELS
ncbi:MAG: glycosyltransferase family 2 protein [Leptolyngbya sp. Prado105]|jgi:glycosyltransferase involved in cell wall biosynthesis|nr:glycosyltransferase family 2 protein [Leptolyngbya sp. Prado105]